MLPLGDAVERVLSPYAPEEFSPLTGAPLLVAHFGEGDPPRAEHLEAAREGLARLPCPTVALGAGRAGSPLAALADAFDVAVETEAELAPVLAGVECAPLAAMALAQLLRRGAERDVGEGLIAESLVYSTLQGGPEFAAWRASRPPARVREANSEPAVHARRERGVLTLSLNRPEKCNAFSTEMRDALAEALRLALCDDSIREIVLRGEGRAFCAGGDLDEFGTLPDPATAHAVRSTRNAAALLAACAERVRAELHGACVGAGVELPAFAGRVVATRDATFELPEVGMGLVPGSGGTVSVPRRVGRQRAAWLALSGVRIDADTALRWGLVDEVRPA